MRSNKKSADGFRTKEKRMINPGVIRINFDGSNEGIRYKNKE